MTPAAGPERPWTRPARRLLRALRWFRPPRVLRPTREGWWFIAAALALGLAATNTGNNLLLLLFAMLLGFITVSGLLSEQAHRRVEVRRTVPEAIHAGAPAHFALTLVNRKRRVPSYSLHLEEADPATGALRRHYLLRLGPGEGATWAYPLVFPRRGPQRLPGYRVWTRFPFGLFTKATRLRQQVEVLVLPALHPLEGARAGRRRGGGERPRPRRGRGADLHALREFRDGDDPRLIHWKSTARSGHLILRELQDEDARRLRLTVEDPDPGASEDAVERDISLAASVAAHWIRRGCEVQLVLPEGQTPWGSHPRHLRGILEALARFQPLPGRAARPSGAAPADAAEVRIALGRGGPAPAAHRRAPDSHSPAPDPAGAHPPTSDAAGAAGG